MTITKILFIAGAGLFTWGVLSHDSKKPSGFKDVITETVVNGKRAGIYSVVRPDGSSSYIGTYCVDGKKVSRC